ncbi:hypothetical protein MKX07_000514 [Trichoderma sp. CBMAI-0711]|uniref:RNase H type-1 domain-containing protein n=1 Tax=Trichoderma parareesei TaxID=858221 RepID=A0A2H2ZY68_TRIPA|nr:hypothetical protein MKX07_000514 [Trichoderma sp. CBMAI-0711]OTA04871.1 hypothetical protein A9Z42_0054690 [Trichoderma parareesei]
MIGRFAQRRWGRTEIANFQVYPERPSFNTVTEALNQHSILITIKRCSSNKTFSSASLLFQCPPYRSFCTQTKIEAKTTSAESNSQPTRVRLSGSAKVRDKALKDEADSYVKSFNDVKGKDGFLSKRAKLSVTRELGFCGKIFIDLKDSALDKTSAIVEEKPDHHHLVLFVDGSVRTQGHRESGCSAAKAGTAVAYKPLGRDQIWVERYFAPARCKRNSVQVETVALLNGLKVAAVETDLLRGLETRSSDTTAAETRVTLFSDCTSALQILEKLQGTIAADSPLLGDGLVRELIAVSQYLHRKGVEVELHWVRGHANVQGNCIADCAARYAAKHPEIGAILEKELQVKLEPLSRATKARTSPQNKPSAKEEKKKSTHCEAATPTILPEVQDHIF